jgi:hypothetical protein
VARPTPHEKLAILERRKHVAHRYVTGQRQHEIARSLEVDLATIKRDLAFIREEWRQDAVRDVGERQAAELAKLDALERTCWEAWERSLLPKETSETRRVQDDAPPGKDNESGQHQARIEALLRREQRDGNPRFLETALNCIKRRCEILGLDAPKGAASGTQTNNIVLNWSALVGRPPAGPQVEGAPDWLVQRINGPADVNGHANGSAEPPAAP